MLNRLAGATIPYLLQHADNPVDWQEWGEEAFAEARERDVPVLVSVGYAACHRCHVSVKLARPAGIRPSIAQPQVSRVLRCHDVPRRMPVYCPFRANERVECAL